MHICCPPSLFLRQEKREIGAKCVKFHFCYNPVWFLGFMEKSPAKFSTETLRVIFKTRKPFAMVIGAGTKSFCLACLKSLPVFRVASETLKK
jgi:hypothetical protein